VSAPPKVTYVFDRESVRAVDRDAVAVYGMPSIVLMENAARVLAVEAMRMLVGRASPRVLVVCGSGNNGGDGYAAARHLHNAGCAITLAALAEPRAHTDAAVNRAICSKMRLAQASLADAGKERFDLIVDAIFGTGLDRQVTGEFVSAIEWINQSGVPILAADIPSGQDCDTGLALGATGRASRTVTFVGMKLGFLVPAARPMLGDITVADIGAPIELTRKYGRPLDS
jgi:NAD(P)H-hydrate epimerase